MRIQQGSPPDHMGQVDPAFLGQLSYLGPRGPVGTRPVSPNSLQRLDDLANAGIVHGRTRSRLILYPHGELFLVIVVYFLVSS